MQFSPDREWIWDGAQWRPAYSPDRRWRWDGRAWVPAGPGPDARWRYEPTVWTRRMQLILVGLMAFGLLAAVAVVPTVLMPLVQQSIDRSLAAQPPGSNVDPAQVRAFLNTFLWTVIIAGLVLGVAVDTVILVGIFRLWRWVYWYFTVVCLLAVIGIPQDVVYAMGVGPVRLPAWLFVLQIPVALAEAALGVWMILLYRRYGTWARRRVPA